ncbi:hypothetical protein FisN_8Hh323 [Fistulifera solaris]|uniref:Letm1 RBD domain-containing protein n=1 Tax=Fistulifera solaris TaxID=1519565 RepID=A0A1Z5KI23_FISSO|nr:hypothetical protein FisN_8Hh323 [Fistulifera solaris]|eukprot:GAX25775.1 hypothetical protein FisN_8Hh323 [Fistulifera solaris]
MILFSLYRGLLVLVLLLEADAFSLGTRYATIKAAALARNLVRSSRNSRTASSYASLSSVSESTTENNDDLDNEVSKFESKTTTEPESASAKLRRLKDLMWVRETLEDMTAAEFAISVETLASDPKRKRKRAVDYEKLIGQLNKRIRDLGCEGPEVGGKPDEETESSSLLNCALQPGVGMGSVVYTDNERTALLERIVRTRQSLLNVVRDNELDVESSEIDLPFAISLLPEVVREKLPSGSKTTKEGSDKSTTRTKETNVREKDSKTNDPNLYVRDDGTVDWDGALQDQAALRKFGKAVWARINGRDPDLAMEDETDGNGNANHHQSHAPAKVVTAQIEETPQIRKARKRLNELKSELSKVEAEHMALLNSALSAGQAVANIRLASLEPQQRNKIRASALSIEILKEKLAFQSLIYDLERIYTYLLGELGNTALKGYIPLQDRLNVAEFGLLAGQIDSLSRQLEAEEKVDADVLLVVTDQVTDFKRRLGIDYLVTGFSLDGESIKRWSVDLLDKTKKGLAFYVKGVRLFWNDNVYCLRLINRAVQGYTLEPREVRTLRRTFKDIITFIPFVIILIIPLSPIGHVLVFGAIQRFFPDFFPSCFTEQRQNLLQLYETAEYSEMTINENFREKLSRLLEAFVFAIANTSKTIYVSMIGLAQREQNAESTNKSDEK